MEHKTRQEYATKLTSNTKITQLMDIYDGVNLEVNYVRMVLSELVTLKISKDTVLISLVIERKNETENKEVITFNQLKTINKRGNNKDERAIHLLEYIKSSVTEKVAAKYCKSGEIYYFDKAFTLNAHDSLKQNDVHYCITGVYMKYGGIHYDYTAAVARRKLEEGNKKYMEKKRAVCNAKDEIRLRVMKEGQHPYAIIVSCSDSRVIPEAIFSAGIGDLFVIRVAGNVIDSHQLGSIEYAAEHLGTGLVVVLGHDHCGAVDAAMNHQPSGYIKFVTDEISKAIKDTQNEYQACCLNVQNSCKIIESSLLIKKDEEQYGLKVVGAIYHMDDGYVEFLG